MGRETWQAVTISSRAPTGYSALLPDFPGASASGAFWENKRPPVGGGFHHHHSTKEKPMLIPSITKSRNDTTGNGVIRPEKGESVADWFQANVVKSRAGMFSEVATVTPDVARIILSGNEANRSVAASHLRRLASDIKDGLWDLNGESIKIAHDGRLADGQHRCLAVIMAGMPINTVITWGVDYESRITTDQNRPKGVGDYLAMAHSTENSKCAAAVSRILLSERLGTDRNNLTKVRIYAEYETNKKAIDSAVSKVLSYGKMQILGGPASVASALVLLRRVSLNADDFIERFAVGNDLSIGDPILAARDRLMRDRHMKPADKIKLIRKAFEAWSDGRKVNKFLVRSRGDKDSRK